MILQRNTLKTPKTFFGGRKLFGDSHFSCSLGKLTLAKTRDVCVYQVIKTEIM
jgi:hypothetical protein